MLRRAASDDEDLIMDSIRDALDVLPVLIESGAELAKNRLHAPRPDPGGEADDDGGDASG